MLFKPYCIYSSIPGSQIRGWCRGKLQSAKPHFSEIRKGSTASSGLVCSTNGFRCGHNLLSFKRALLKLIAKWLFSPHEVCVCAYMSIHRTTTLSLFRKDLGRFVRSRLTASTAICAAWSLVYFMGLHLWPWIRHGTIYVFFFSSHLHMINICKPPRLWWQLNLWRS